MHWLLLLAILSTSTNLKSGSDPSSMNRLAENALRKQLGGSNAVRAVRVNVVPGSGSGDFKSFNVTLDGFSADRLAGLEDDTNSNSSDDPYQDDSYDYDNDYDPQDYNSRNRNSNDDDLGYELGLTSNTRMSQLDIEDLLGGLLKNRGAGRIGSIRLRATNFTYGGARYDALDAQLGEIRFDWMKALRGDFDVKSIQPGTLSLNLRADQAAKLIAPRMPSIKNLTVRFANGRAVFGGRAGWNSLQVPFEAGARLSVQSNQVRADEIRLSVSRLRLPSFVMNELTRGVNPLYDFDPKRRLPIAVNLNTAGTPNNALTLRGGVKWVGFNRNNRDDDYRDNDREETSTRDEEPRRKPSILEEILGR